MLIWPDCSDRPYLVRRVCQVVSKVEDVVIHNAKKVAEEVAQRVDGPTNGGKETVGVGCRADTLVQLTPFATCPISPAKELEQHETTAGQTIAKPLHGL